MKNYYIFLAHRNNFKKSVNDEYNMTYYEDGEDTENEENLDLYKIKIYRSC